MIASSFEQYLRSNKVVFEPIYANEFADDIDREKLDAHSANIKKSNTLAL